MYHALPIAVLTLLAVADQGHPAQDNGRSRGTARSMLQLMTKGKEATSVCGGVSQARPGPAWQGSPARG
jgi:hypothetical protein